MGRERGEVLGIGSERRPQIFIWDLYAANGLPCWFRGKRICLQYETRGPSLGWEDPWRRGWQSIPVFLPGKCRGCRSPAGQPHGVARVRQDLATKPPTTMQQCQEMRGQLFFLSVTLRSKGYLVLSVITATTKQMDRLLTAGGPGCAP